MNKCTKWQLWVKLYLGLNGEHSLGDSPSDSPGKLLLRGKGAVSVYVILVKGVCVQWSPHFGRMLPLVMRSRSLSTNEFSVFLDMRRYKGLSLVSQWWRICLAIQEIQVQSLGREGPTRWQDPTRLGAAQPVHSYWASALEPGPHSCWSLRPQSPCSTARGAATARGPCTAARGQRPFATTKATKTQHGQKRKINNQ